MIKFTVYGHAQPAGSKRGFAFKRANGSTGVAISDANPKSREWKNSVRAAAMEAYKGDLLRGPLQLSLAFYMPRPKGHFGTGKNAASLKVSAPSHPTGKPDCTKLLRGVEDALTEVIWKDDAQIVLQEVSKHYGERACVAVIVNEIAHPQPATD